MLTLTVLVACSTADSGRDKAEAVLRGFNLSVISIGPDPQGWAGTARPVGGGYTMRVLVTNDGLLEQNPDPCRC